MRFRASSALIGFLFLIGSAGVAKTVADATVSRVSPGTIAVTWEDPEPVDVYVADRPDAPLKAAKRVSKADADGRFELADSGVTRRYFLLRDTRSGEIVRAAERLVPLAQGSNFRDIGGYPAADGKHVRWGQIYRSGATPLLTDADIARVEALGLKNMIDLRSREERAIAPTRLTRIPYQAVDYSMLAMMGDRRAVTNGGALYRNFPTFLAPQLKLVFDDLLRNEGPIVYNCSAGQDRTGFTTAMVLSALGVPRDVIIADYHLSTALRQPQFEMPRIDAETAKANPVAGMFAAFQDNPSYSKAQPLKDADGAAFLDSAFAEIESRWGSVDAYLEQEVGLTKADRALLRKAYLE